MKYSELEKKLTKAGCYFIRQGKKHPVWFSLITGKEFQTTNHKGEEVKKGTLMSISKDSGVRS